MRSKTKGFTITELLAVIVIMGILITIASASYNGISKNLKERTYNNKIDLIKSKAIEYATDYGVEATTISVAKLIEEGYIEQENDTENNEKLNNPLGGYFDCYQVDINRVLEDYEINVSASTDCSLAQMDILSSKLDILAYKASDNLLINQNYLGSNKDIKWTNDDVYLYLTPESLNELSEHDMTITWSFNGENKTSNGPIYNKENNPGINSDYINVYRINTNYLVNTSVTVKVQTSKGLLAKSVNVKIDKAKPTLTLDTEASYEQSSKVITFNGSDGEGSGFASYSYALTEDLNEAPNFNITAEEKRITVYENKTYYAYAKDQVGNVSEAVPISITNIDNSKPVCKNPVNNSGWSTSYTYTYGCKSDVGSGCATPDKTETQTDQAEYKKVNWDVSDNIGNTRACQYNLAVHVDRTNPTCSIEAFGKKNSNTNKWFIDDVSLYLSVADEISGVSEYGITTSPNAEYNGKNQALLTTDTTDAGIKYYGYVKDKAGNVGTCSITVYRLKEQPTCELSVDKNPDGDNGWYRSNATVKLSSSSKYVTAKSLNNTNRDSFTVSSDTSGVKVSGTVTNVAGSVSSCKNTIIIKKDTEAPKCTINASGNSNNGWYISDVAMSISPTDSLSGVASYGINANNRTYNNVQKTNLTWDTDGITYYGIVKDNAGNEGTCEATVKRLATPPTCTINASGTKGANNWYVSNITNTITSNSPHVVSKKITANNSESYVINQDNDGTTLYGEVVNVAGVKGTCSNWTKRLAETPSCSIDLSGTMGQNNWYISNITAKVSSSSAHVASKKITNNNNNSDSYTVNWDTGGITFNGTVTNEAGTSNTCSKWARRVVTPPSCNISSSGTKGWNNWYTSNVYLSVTGSGLGATYGTIMLPNGVSNSSNYTLTSDTGYITVTGRYYNEAGLYRDCSTQVRKDSTSPAANLGMKILAHHCQYELNVHYSGSCGGSTQTPAITCDVWDQNGLDDEEKLKEYLKNPESYTITNRRHEWDDYSDKEAGLVCNDTTSGIASYSINGKNGQAYSFMNDSYAQNNHYFTYSGTCYDNAGNSTTTSAEFDRYEEPEEVEDTEDYFGKTNCETNENSCAEITYECQKGTEEKCVYKKCDKEGSNKCDKPQRNDEVTGSHTEGEYKWRVR